MPVAQTCRHLHPDRPIYIAGDNDHRQEAAGKQNVGGDSAPDQNRRIQPKVNILGVGVTVMAGAG